MPVRPGARIVAISAAILLVHGFAHRAVRAQEPPTATVSGVVKNRLTGQPIPRALVNCQADAMLTDSEGRFELHLPIGFVQLQVRRPGFSTGEHNRNGRSLNVEGDIDGLVVYLTPTATITGRVSTGDGSDANGMNFIAYRRRTVNGNSQWLQAGFANTDPDGIFRFYDLESPGDYVLCSYILLDRTAGPRQGKPARGFPSQCYPADPGDGPDNLLHLAAGQQAEVEITRTMQPFYPVKVPVPNHSQEQPGSFEVRAQNGLPIGAQFQWNLETHTADVNLPNGSYYAIGQTWNPPATFGRVDFKVENRVSAPAPLVELPLPPILVQIHKDFTARTDPQQTQVFVGNPDAAPVYLNLEPADRMAVGGGGGRPIHRKQGTPADAWELEGMTPGRYRVQVISSFEGYVSSITSGGVDLTREPLMIGPGNTVAPIDITLRNDTGQIDCTVNGLSTRAMPKAGITFSTLQGMNNIWVIPVGSRPTRLIRAGGQIGQQVIMGNLAPGTYRVLALDDDRDLETADDQELQRLEDKGKTVTVPAGGTATVQLDLIKADDEEPTP